MLSRRSLLVAAVAVVARPTPAFAGTPPDGRYLAVLDRFETGADGARLAVLVLERAGETRGRLVVEAAALPAAGRHVDAVLEVVVEGGELSSASYRPEETRRRAERAQREFDRLAHGPCREG